MPDQQPTSSYDSAFEVAGSRIRFGPGVSGEVGMDLADLGVRRVMVVTDSNLASMEPVARVCRSLADEGVDYALYDGVGIEPTDASFTDAVRFAQDGGFDAYVAIGGGSCIDTAKVADLCATYPADLLAYVNPPLGEGRAVPGPVKPLIAIPTTAGTGSETTGVAVFDLEAQQVKTGIAHPRLRPMLGLLDPDHLATVPPLVAASTGLDVLCHAIESYTARWYDRRPRPDRPSARPNYQGANPISDAWSALALRMTYQYLPRVSEHPDDQQARGQMMLAATYAGIGFGNAGVHLPHAMSYPIAGLVRDYHPPGYPGDRAIAPHGIAVLAGAPAALRFTAEASPSRHLEAAAMIGAETDGVDEREAGLVLADQLIALMRRLNLPNGISGLGYGPDDLDALAKGAVKQQRLTKLAPREVDEPAMRSIFEQAMRYW